MTENTHIPGDGAALKAALDKAGSDRDAVVLVRAAGPWHLMRWDGDALLPCDDSCNPLHPFDPKDILGIFAEPGGFRLLCHKGEFTPGVSFTIRIVRTDGRPFEDPCATLESLAGRAVLYRLCGPAGTETPCGLEWDAGRVEVAEPGEPAAHAVVSLTTGRRTALKGGAARDSLNPNLYLAETEDGIAAEIRL